MGDTGLVLNRWRRYGKDRLYVSRLDQSKVGWWDLVTDEAHPESPDLLQDLTAAVSAWRTGRSEAVPSPASSPATAVEPGPVALPTAGVDHSRHPTPAPDEGPSSPPDAGESAVAADRPWIDLVTNRAGEAAREQAAAAREAAPVRTFLARVVGVHTDEAAWRIGADGEEKVATQLAKLVRKDPRWRVIHAIPVGTRGSDIDHLVVGPGGVFTLNAKQHRDAKIWVGGSTFLVNGTRQPYVRNSRHESERAARLLSDACGFAVHVEGVIVPVNAADLVIKSQPDGVSVVPRMQIARWLRRHGAVLDDATVEAVHDVARRSTTWRG